MEFTSNNNFGPGNTEIQHLSLIKNSI
jgi:hypothetical protein